jgi:hypothetical protein
MKQYVTCPQKVRHVVRMRISSKRGTLVTVINEVTMVINVIIVNVGKLAILATKVSMQQENTGCVCNIGNHGNDSKHSSHKTT